MNSQLTFKERWREYTILALLLLNILVWLSLYDRDRGGEIATIYFLDVGQGDAILIDSPTHNRVLIDGGKNRQILGELGKILPFGDRRIDVVVVTHPDADHIGGLPEVVSRYDVGVLLESGAESENSLDEELDSRLLERGVEKILAKRGMVIHLGGGAELRILFPNGDVSNLDTNDASIIAEFVYGESEVLLTGDAGIKTENMLTLLDREALDTDILKFGLHGSRTSTSLAFAELASPEYSIISASAGNSYGHPHREVLNILESVGSQIFSTAERGTIIFETNGKTWGIK